MAWEATAPPHLSPLIGVLKGGGGGGASDGSLKVQEKARTRLVSKKNKVRSKETKR